MKTAQGGNTWPWLISAFCALRAANEFTVWMAWLVFICRMCQLGSGMIGNRMAYEFIQSMIAFFLLLMIFNEFANENADIVHEVIAVEG